jgi:uncharacterized protein YcbK (DUF882 family)
VRIVPTVLAALAATAISAQGARSERAAHAPGSPTNARMSHATSGHATSGHATKKGDGEIPASPPLLATLAQLHTDERVMLDASEPAQARFDAMMSDRVTGSSHALDARLLGLLRTLAAKLGAAVGGSPSAPVRIELVSGYRSPKLNEQLRKKGHHVASHSQHSLGHACDFRIVLPGATKAIEPRVLEKQIRALGWDGGTGTYPQSSDWFVHADVGPKRNWVN